jgi:hypothetical protein
MEECRQTAQSMVALRGYRMDAECLAEWERRCTREMLRAMYLPHPGVRIAQLRLGVEQVLVGAIMEAQARHSRVLILADLHAASAKLGFGTPFCGQG